MIDCNDALPVVRQCEILLLSRSSVYYRRQPVSPDDLALMRRIGELRLELPVAGTRMLRDLLRLEEFKVSRQRIARLIRLMGAEALYRKPNTSRRTYEPTSRCSAALFTWPPSSAKAAGATTFSWTTLEARQVRGDRPARLQHCGRRQAGFGALLPVLQHPPATLVA